MRRDNHQSDEPTATDLEAHLGEELRNPDRGVSLGVLVGISGDRAEFATADGRVVDQSLDTVEMKLRTGAMTFSEVSE